MSNIISADNGSFTGTAGIKLSSDTSGALALQTGNNVTALTVDSSQNLSLVGGLTVSGSSTLSGGTANGVAYLNGSKVLTTGSALVFDGTNVGIGTASPTQKLQVAGNARLGTGAYLGFPDSGNAFLRFSNGEFIATSGQQLQLCADNSDGTIAFFTTSTGSASNERMRIDSSGNVGIGVTPSAWGAGTSVIDLNTSGNAGAVASSGTLSIANNGFFNGTNWIYKNSSSALLYQLISNQHRWSIAPVGTAGNAITFTQAMTLDASGNLLVGATSGLSRLLVVGSGATSANNNAIFLNSASTNLFTIRNDGYTYAPYWYATTTASAANVNVDTNGGLLRSTSALKYKQDIRDLENIDISKFRAVRYKSKCDGDDQTIDHFGFIADEVDSSGIKELVSYGANGEVEGFQYDRMTTVLLKAIQEQQAIITQLQADVASLKGPK